MGRLTQWIDYIGNHRTSFGFGVFIIVSHLIITAERVYTYRHSNPWVVIARSGGMCLHFECVLVLLLVLRRTISWLRSRALDWLLPLDRHVHYHKIMGWTICVVSLIHTVAHLVNYGYRSDAERIPFFNLVFDQTAGWIPGMVGPSGFILLFILFIMGIFAQHRVRKSGRFELFYWTHLLFVPFFALAITHAGNVWKWFVGPLSLYAIEVLYRIWFILSDRGKSQVSTLLLLPNQVVRVKIQRPPNFEFLAGDYVYVNIPQIAKYEWHPFTISSSPEEEEFMTIHVRVAGGWTARLYAISQNDAERLIKHKSVLQLARKLNRFRPLPPQLETEMSTDGQDNWAFQSEDTTNSEKSVEITLNLGTPFRTTKVDANEFSPPEMPIILDGPYGGSSARVWKSRHALLIGGGIGVTPFASLLQTIASRYQNSMSPCPHCTKPSCTNLPASMGKLKHVDFMWINRDLLSFQWFLEMLLDLDREQAVRGSAMEKFLDIHLYQTGSNTISIAQDPCRNCSETLKGIPKAEKNTLSDSSSVAIRASSAPIGGKCPYCIFRQVNHLLRFGRPVWDEIFKEIAMRSVGRVTVFYCGPATMGNDIRAKCREFGFIFTKEIF